MSHSSHGHVESGGHEPDRASVKGVLVFGLLVVVLVLGAIGAEAAHLIYFDATMPDRVVANAPDVSQLPERVGGWIKPGVDLAVMKKREKDLLESYGWVDQKAGVVHIPIERAMQLLAQPASQKPGEGR